MKSVLTFTLAISIAYTSLGQEINRKLEHFDKIVASPYINLKLKPGNQEEITVVYEGVDEHKINIDVASKTLHLYLDDARFFDATEGTNWTEKNWKDQDFNYRNSHYDNAKVTAYVTFTTLQYLEIRGNQILSCLGPLESPDFTIKGYGENKIALAEVYAKELRVVLAGENKLYIQSGEVNYQKYRLFGNNEVDTKSVVSESCVANLYGENDIKVHAEDELRINSFGDSEIYYKGNPDIDKGLNFGESKLYTMKSL